jgi:hypothetical protein
MVQCLLLVKLRLVIFTELLITLPLLQLAILLLLEAVAVLVLQITIMVEAVAVLVVCKPVRFLLVDLQRIPLLLEAGVQAVQIVVVFRLLVVLVVLLYFLVSHQQEVVEAVARLNPHPLVEVVAVALHGQVLVAALAFLVKVIQGATLLMGVLGLEVVVEKGAVVVKVMPLALLQRVVVGVEVLHLYRVVP